MPHPLRSALLAATLLGLLARPGLAADPADAPSAAGAYLAGDFAVSRGDMARATEDFLAALAADPQNRGLTRHAFLAALMSGNPAASRLARTLPGDEAATLLLADDNVALADWSGALHRFESLPTTGVIALMRPLLIAWAQYGGGDTDAALATLQPPPGQQRIPGVYVLHAAMIADLAGRTAEADASYQRAAAASAQTLDVREGQILASWQMRQGRPDAAAATLRHLGGTSDEVGLTIANLWRSAMRRPVGSAADGIAEVYLEMASAMRAQDATDFAQLLLHLALDLRPDFGAARLLLAGIDDAGGRPRLALAELAAIPVADPLAPMAAMQRALLRDDLGDPARAIADLRTLAAAHPHHSAPLVALGDTLRQEHQYRAAITAYSQALTLLPGPKVVAWNILFSRGVAYDRLDDWPRAEADLRAALALAPQRPSLLNYLGYSLADRGIDLTEARSMIAHALQQRPHDAAILDSMGWVMLRQGQVADAVATLLRAVEASPEDATINAHLGDAFAAAREPLQASYQWRRALALHPEPPDAARLEAKLRQTPSAAVAHPLAASARAAAPVR